MRSRSQLLLVLVAASMMTACASSPLPVPPLPKPLPPEYVVPCPPPVEQPANDPDAVMVALKNLYDLYGTCAGRLVDLVGWLQKKE